MNTIQSGTGIVSILLNAGNTAWFFIGYWILNGADFYPAPYLPKLK